jgi:hypothetical protein
MCVCVSARARSFASHLAESVESRKENLKQNSDNYPCTARELSGFQPTSASVSTHCTRQFEAEPTGAAHLRVRQRDRCRAVRRGKHQPQHMLDLRTRHRARGRVCVRLARRPHITLHDARRVATSHARRCNDTPLQRHAVATRLRDEEHRGDGRVAAQHQRARVGHELRANQHTSARLNGANKHTSARQLLRAQPCAAAQAELHARALACRAAPGDGLRARARSSAVARSHVCVPARAVRSVRCARCFARWRVCLRGARLAARAAAARLRSAPQRARLRRHSSVCA